MKKVLFLFVFILLTACNATTPTSQLTPSPTIIDSNAYPQPGDLPTSYPVPELQETATQSPTSTPDPTKGSVTGILQLKGVPVTDARLYLADILNDEEGNEIAASFDPANSPVSFTNSDGNFTFTNINPGRYSLILNNSINSYMLFIPNTQDNLIVEVSVSQIFNFGTLNYDDLPIINSSN